VIYTLPRSYRRHRLNPYDYLKDLSTRLAAGMRVRVFSSLPYLTFQSTAGTFCAANMKRRGATLLVCLLYVSVALFFGMVHDHESHSGPYPALTNPDHCAACEWQMKAISGVPVVMVSILVAFFVITDAPQNADHFRLPAYFAAATASRAPPVVSA
jgi:hypothetical protein